MSKYLQMFLKALFVLLCFYLSYNVSYIGFSLLIIEFTFFSLIFFPLGILIVPIVLFYNEINISYIFLVLFALSFLKPFFCKNKYYLSLYIILTSFLSCFIYYQDILLACLLLPMYALLTLSYIYVTDVYKIQRTQIRINNYPFFLAILVFIMCFGSINVRHSLFYISFLLMVLSLFSVDKISFILSIVLLTIYPTKAGLIFPFITILLMFQKIGFIIILALTIYNYFLSLIPLETYELLIAYALFFPFTFRKKQSKSNYHNLVLNFNEQILKFASFLDNFARNFTTPSRVKNKLSEGFENIVNAFYKRCSKSDTCFDKYKNETYSFIKSALIYGTNIHMEINTTDLKRLSKNCIYANDIINKANFWKNKYQLSDSSIREKALNSQIIGISSTIKQYAIDMVSKKEIPFPLFDNLKNKILKNGYPIILFNIKKYFTDDFLIEIGINQIDEQTILHVIKKIASIELKQNVSINIDKTINNVTYFQIVPKNNYQFLYGMGSLAKDDLNITGDNFLIKESHNNFIAALSDGMGSGYKAYEESKLTLDMVNKITEFEINVRTSINMLNTFYSLKDNMDSYATLDLLEINKTTGEAILYKMGSSDSFIYTNSELEVINNKNLPFGIDDLISENNFALKNNDLILLMSDGLRDNITNNELINIITTSLDEHPQKISYNILNHIVQENKMTDDMSLITIKIVKSN